MKLIHIKLAGFKSFCDPTTILVPGQRVAVVGPNGCGKSNVIDAVRWVLGESSARQLRGESMQDVIFNGSLTRKPMSRASVELAFDNQAGLLNGIWGQYSEISIKRVLTRQGDSNYYINNQVVRRRDITDLFLGTGVGARGYAVIEQGMISRIIEARPEELRIFLEEASGVSKYKDRRKDTHTKIQDTLGHLQRLSDITLHLNEQCQLLEVQASKALSYKSLQQNLSFQESLLLYVRYEEARLQTQKLEQELALLDENLQAEEQLQQHVLTQKDALFLQLEASQQELNLLLDLNGQVQAKQSQTNLSVQQKKMSLEKGQSERQTIAQQIESLEQERQKLQYELEELQWTLEALSESMEQSSIAYDECHEQWSQAKAMLDSAQKERLAKEEALKAIDVQRYACIQKQSLATQAFEHGRLRLEEVAASLASLDLVPAEDIAVLHQEQDTLIAKQTVLEEQLAKAETLVLEHQTSLDQAVLAVQSNALDMAKAHSNVQLMAQMLNRQKNSQETEYLHESQQEHAVVLYEKIQIDGHWKHAFDACLNNRLFARMASLPKQGLKERLVLIDQVGDLASFTALQQQEGHLLSKIVADESLQAALAQWLAPYHLATSYEWALEHRHELGRYKYFVTPEGHLVDAYSVHFFALSQEDSVLDLKEKKEVFDAQLTKLKQESIGIAEQQTQISTTLMQAKEAYKLLQAKTVEFERARMTLQWQLENQIKRYESFKQQSDKLNAQSVELQKQHQEILNALNLYHQQVLDLDAQKEEAQYLFDFADEKVYEIHEQVSALDSQLSAKLQQKHQKNLAHSTQQALLGQHGIAQDKLNHQIQTWTERLQQLQGQDDESLFYEIETLETYLIDLEDQSMQYASQIEALREGLNLIHHQMKILNIQADSLMQKLPGIRVLREKNLMKLQGLLSMQEVLKEQLNRMENLDWSVLHAYNVGAAQTKKISQEIENLKLELAKLGDVNLSAQSQWDEAHLQLVQMQSQVNDVEQALGLLEEAMHNIDAQIRERLQETFDLVNQHLSEVFAALFGGGEAALSLLGTDILDAGLQILARPPGKKNSTIQLLSGGEKALTAMSLVFAFFALNPAPFCLLDEVDAPLDDANTERFCQWIKRLSEQTQFLYISHNRLTMQMAEQLIGVTMQEKGVSRTVSVEVLDDLEFEIGV